MKIIKMAVIVVGLISIIFFTTNPSSAEHKDAVKEKVRTLEKSSSDNEYEKFAKQIQETVKMNIIENSIIRENYFLFSLTKCSNFYFDNDKFEHTYFGLGILDKVYLSEDYIELIKENLFRQYNKSKYGNSINDSKREELNKSIIGTPIIIGKIEIAQNDFPDIMNWYDAKDACNSLGIGWRLPTREELKILYNNKSKIGGFTDYFYWGSSIDENGWVSDMSFFEGAIGNSPKNLSGKHVRAVKSL
jgi:hypothetical protein